MTAGWTEQIGNLLALTPYERFEAMRRLDSGFRTNELLTNKWFVLLGWSVVFILLMILIAIRQQRSERERKLMIQRFEQQANDVGLTMEERDLLFLISRHARLRRPAAVFSLQNAFEKGVAGVLKKKLQDPADEETARQLNRTVESIKKKIGFAVTAPMTQNRFRGGRFMTSRQIAAGKSVSVAPVQDGPALVEGEVTANAPEGICIKLCKPLHLKSGEVCILQVQFGAVLWGFEMVVLVSRGEDLELHHADHARYLNRRRFLRVPVHKPALVAPLPSVVETHTVLPARPAFTEAEVKELSGPGLRLRTSLEVEVRSRILVIFELEPGRVIQDVAEVRRISESVTGRTLAVELIGLSETVEDELIRVTNQLALKQGIQDREAMDFAETQDIPEEAAI